MTDSLISIIIPTYNRSHLIGQTLDSIKGQTYNNWECIVVDDRSTDHTPELMGFYCEKDNRIQYYRLPADRTKGANACRNYGFELSRGNKIIWFDSDDIMLADYFALGMNMVLKNPEVDVIVCDYEIFDDVSGDIIHEQKNVINNIDIDYLIGDINFGCPHLIWNREVVQQVKFDENLVRAQELDFHLKVFITKKIKWLHIKESLVRIRRHKISITGKFLEGSIDSLESELKVRRKILDYLNNNNFEEDILKKAFQIYLRSFYVWIRKFSLYSMTKELKQIESLFCFKRGYLRWKLRFIVLLVLFKFFKKEYRLKIQVFSLPNYLYVSR